MIGDGSPRCVVANMFDWDIAITEFEPQSCDYVLFRINTHGKDMNSFIPQK